MRRIQPVNVLRTHRSFDLVRVLAPFVFLVGLVSAQTREVPDPGLFGSEPTEDERAALEKAFAVLESAARQSPEPSLRGTSEYSAILMRNKLATGRIRCFGNAGSPSPHVAETFPDEMTTGSQATTRHMTVSPDNVVRVDRYWKSGKSSVFLASYLLHEAIHCIQELDIERAPNGGGPCDPEEEAKTSHLEVESYCWQLRWLESLGTYPLPVPFVMSISDQRLAAGAAWDVKFTVLDLKGHYQFLRDY